MISLERFDGFSPFACLLEIHFGFCNGLRWMFRSKGCQNCHPADGERDSIGRTCFSDAHLFFRLELKYSFEYAYFIVEGFSLCPLSFYFSLLSSILLEPPLFISAPLATLPWVAAWRAYHGFLLQICPFSCYYWPPITERADWYLACFAFLAGNL